MTNDFEDQQTPQPAASGPTPTPPPPPAEPVDEKQSRMWAMLCHLTALVMFIGVPLGNIIGPLVIWLLKKNEFPFVDQNGKEALNFQISITIYAAVAFLLCLVFIGFFLLIALGIFDLVMIIVASIKTNDGEAFRYPVTIRFIK